MRSIIRAGAPAEGVNSITDLLQDNVVPLIITVVAVFALFAARKGEVSNVLTIFIAVVFGVLILVFAIPAPRDAILGWFSGIVSGS